MLGLDYLTYERLMHVAVPHVLEPLVRKTLSRRQSCPKKSDTIGYDCTSSDCSMMQGSAFRYNMLCIRSRTHTQSYLCGWLLACRKEIQKCMQPLLHTVYPCHIYSPTIYANHSLHLSSFHNPFIVNFVVLRQHAIFDVFVLHL